MIKDFYLEKILSRDPNERLACRDNSEFICKYKFGVVNSGEYEWMRNNVVQSRCPHKMWT